MHVIRTVEGGDLLPFRPAQGCSCYYTERATGLAPPPGCQTCNGSSDCPVTAPICNRFAAQTRGYCEL
jgi:hypothetical protein